MSEIRFVDPLHPSRGLRNFLFDKESKKFIDKEDQSRRISFAVVFEKSWQTSGNGHLGKKVLRLSYDEFGKINEKLIFTVERWLPSSASDFIDASGNPAPLWRAVDNKALDAVDLEESELLDGRAAYSLQDGLSIYKYSENGALLPGVLFWKSVEKYDEAVVVWDGGAAETMLIVKLYDADTRVSAVDILWVDQPLSDFVRIESPYKWCDCIPEYRKGHSMCRAGASSKSSIGPPTAHRKRGRPRKFFDEELQLQCASSPAEYGETPCPSKEGAASPSPSGATSMAMPIKKMRGRPRKVEGAVSSRQNSGSTSASSGPAWTDATDDEINSHRSDQEWEEPAGLETGDEFSSEPARQAARHESSALPRSSCQAADSCAAMPPMPCRPAAVPASQRAADAFLAVYTGPRIDAEDVLAVAGAEIVMFRRGV